MPNGVSVEPVIAAVVAELSRLEDKYSRYKNSSLTSQINAAAGSGSATPIDAETAGLLRYASTVWSESGHVFDLTSGVLRTLWDFKSGCIPQRKEVELILPLVGWQLVQWTQESVYLPQAGMELDFGGVAKEYAADAAAAVLRQHGVLSALVDLAGDMAAVGGPTQKSGWPVGIRHPEHLENAIADVVLREGGLASSGDYERCMVVDGKRYGHILDPRTGWPVVPSGPVAVSVMAPQCLVAGSSATVAMLKPIAESIAWLEQLGLPWLLIDRDMRCHGNLG